MRIIILLAALIAAFSAAAQQPDLSRVPGIPIKSAQAIAGTPIEAAAMSRVTSPAATATSSSTSVADEQRKLDALRARAGTVRASVELAIKPPPSSLTMKTGVTEVIPISINQLNRLRTPFSKPVIKTLSDAVDTSVEGRVVYVAASTPEKFSMFVWNEGDPDQAISLMLLPRDVVPIDMEVKLSGYEPRTQAVSADEDGDELVEESYVGQIKGLFRALAQGEVPRGYALRSIAPNDPLMPECLIPGVQVSAAQLLEGRPFPAIVARAVNRTSRTVQIDETGCAGDEVLAVAAWPAAELAPGEATELYILVRPVAPRRAGQARPSLLRTGS